MNYTPLHSAAYKNSKEIGELLLSKGANINSQDFDQQNLTKYLYKNELNATEGESKKMNRTPFYWAATNNSKEMVDLLISKGADFNLKNVFY